MLFKFKRVYVCSPCSAPTEQGIKQNMVRARGYASTIERQYNCKAYAPHAYLPSLLDDNNADDRRIAMQLCFDLLNTCDAVFVFGNKVSDGMRKEITMAAKAGIPVVLCSQSLAYDSLFSGAFFQYKFCDNPKVLRVAEAVA